MRQKVTRFSLKIKYFNPVKWQLGKILTQKKHILNNGIYLIENKYCLISFTYDSIRNYSKRVYGANFALF